MNTIHKIAAALVGLTLVAGITAACGSGGGGPSITDAQIAANIQSRCGYSVVVDDPHSFGHDPANADNVVDGKTFKPDGRVNRADTRVQGDAIWLDTGGVGHYVCPGDTQGHYVWDGNQWQRLTD
jgi:hypothetical protein